MFIASFAERSFIKKVVATTIAEGFGSVEGLFHVKLEVIVTFVAVKEWKN